MGMLVIPAAAVGLLILAFAWFHVRQSRAALALMSAGVILFLTIPVQEHLEVMLRIGSDLGSEYRRPRIHTALEEGAEVFGSLSFLAGGLIFARLRSRMSGLEARKGGIALPLGIRQVALIGSALGFGLLLAHLFIPHLMFLRDYHGRPQNWFPSVLALLASLMCLILARTARSSGGGNSSAALLLLAMVNLLLSIDHGSDHRWHSYFLSSWMPEWIPGLLVATGTVATALLFWSQVRSPAARAAAVLWALLLVLGYPAENAAGSLLSFGAYLGLLLGLTTLLPRETGSHPASRDALTQRAPAARVSDAF